MNDKNNNALETPEKKNKENDKAATASPKKPFKWSILFIIISLLLASASLAAATYIWLQFQQYQQQSNASINNAINEVNNSLQQKIGVTDLSQHVTPLLSPINAQLQAFEQSSLVASQARDSLTESTQKLFELYGRDQNGWQLAEVEYLLRIAQHRLVIENDFQGAAKTLKAADEKITEIADPGLLPIRVAISDERVLLQTRTRPDLVGIVLSLSRISKQIPHLDLSLNKTDDSSKASTMAKVTRDANAPWQDQVWQFVMGLVKVEPLKKSISTPTVSLINAVNTLEENLKLAKWAVLERDQQQYSQLMMQSNNLFKQYFDPNNNYHAEINTELERLLSLEIRPKLPDISGSLVLLKTIIEKKSHQVPTAQLEQNSEPSESPEKAPTTPAQEEKGDSDE